MSPKYLKTIILVSVFFMMYQGIANSDLGIISELTHQNGNNWAGPLSTALLFLGSGLSSLYNKYIGRYSFRMCFFVGSFGYTLFIALGLIFMKLGFSIMIQIQIFVASFFAGCIFSIFTNAQENYINSLAKIDNMEIKYFAISMGFIQSSDIFGNLLSSLLIGPLGQFNSVLVLQIIIFCISVCFLFIPEPEKKEQNLLQPAEKCIQNENDLPNSLEHSQISQINQGYLNITEQRMSPLRICCCFCFSGIAVSYVYCLLSIILYETFDKMSDVELNHLTYVLFTFEGVGEFLGGLLIIFASHKIKDQAKVLMIASLVFIFSMLIVHVGSIYQNIYIIGCGIVLSGLTDCIIYVMGLTLAGLWKKKGYSIFNISQCFTIASSTILMAFVPVYGSMIWISAFFVANIIGLQLYRKSKSKTQINLENAEIIQSITQ